MHSRTQAFIAALAAGTLAPSLALAHTGLGAHGAFDGLAHPFLGADHLLAMVAVGLWAARLGGAAQWAVPVSFVAVMALGATLPGMAGIEGGIGASVVVLGLMVALAVRVPTVAAALLVAAFAAFHGAAHGAEMPSGASGLAYGAGFIAATTALHGAGLVLGQGGWRLARALGALTAAGGALLIFA